MKLLDLTPELQKLFEAPRSSGVLVLEGGPLTCGTEGDNYGGWIPTGVCLWSIGNREISSVREMVAEILRLNARLCTRTNGDEGCRGSVRAVYSGPSGSTTLHLAVNEAVEEELKKLSLRFDLPTPISLLGMQVTKMTEQIAELYGIWADQGVLVVTPGPDHQLLGIGELQEGYYFREIGTTPVASPAEMVAELLRVHAIPRPVSGKGGAEGYHGHVRVIYVRGQSGAPAAGYMALTDEQAQELRELLPKLSEARPANDEVRGVSSKVATTQPASTQPAAAVLVNEAKRLGLLVRWAYQPDGSRRLSGPASALGVLEPVAVADAMV